MRRIFHLFTLAAVAAACTPKVSDRTEVTGSFAAAAPESVQVTVPDLGIDSTVAVTAGKFAIVLPAGKLALASVKAEDAGVRFIPDGTPLAIRFDGDGNATVTSKHPKVSLQARFDAFKQSLADLQKTFQARLDSALKDVAPPETDPIQEKIYDEYQAASDALNLKALSENKDNALSLFALDNLRYSLPDARLDSLLGTLDSAVLKVPAVARLSQVLQKRKATAEGQMFTDFEVNGQKLSDYVGRGKYVLVDFWASWCGPCKGEIPNLKNVYGKYRGRSFDLLSVAVWDKPQASLDTARAYGIGWNHIVDARQVPTDLYGIQGIPHIILFGPDGTILRRGLRGEDIEAEVARYVRPLK